TANMRFLGVGDCADLASLYLRLLDEGHEVKVYIGQQNCADILLGLVPRVDDWRDELEWVKAAGPEGCLLFETIGSGRGAQQDVLRRDGFNVIGSSAYGAKLEMDRAFAQSVLAELGLSIIPTVEFANFIDAQRYVHGRPRRYVLKFNGASG